MTDIDQIDRELVKKARYQRRSATQDRHRTSQAGGENEAEAARVAERAAIDKVKAALSEWILSHGEPIGLLDGTRPVVLFPVRLETRYFEKDLKVRIYPDEILVDAHERELTRAELDGGQKFWRACWKDLGIPAETDKERAEWALLAAQLNPQRAAHAIVATKPDNLAKVAIDHEPTFPPFDYVKKQPWSSAPSVALLPDRWIVRGYVAGKRVFEAWSKVVSDLLAVSISPLRGAKTTVVAGMTIDAEAAWTVDYDDAEACGMAITIANAPRRIDRLIVAGVRSSVSPLDGAKEIEDLFRAHHLSQGFDVLELGTPTSNIVGEASAHPPAPIGISAIASVLRPTSSSTPRTEMAPLARILGIRADLGASITVAAPEENVTADGKTLQQAMNAAVWPATLGLHARVLLADWNITKLATTGEPQIVEPALSLASRIQLRNFFVESVNGRGHTLPFRVGVAPYGVLPVTSLTALEVSGFKAALKTRLLNFRSKWLARVESVPRVRRPSPQYDADDELLRAVGMTPRSSVIIERKLLGPDLTVSILGSGWSVAKNEALKVLTDLVALPDGIRPLIGELAFAAGIQQATSKLVDGAIDEKLFSQLKPSPRTWPEAIKRLQTELADGTAPEATFLSRVVAQSILSTLLDVGVNCAERPIVPGGVGGAPGTLSFELFESNAAPIFDAIGLFSNTPDERVRRALLESLDCTTHRLDAWITALVMSDAYPTTDVGRYVGAYGWVEDLQADTASRGEAGGYIHTPSMAQASAAAILRNGAITRRGNGREYEIDLSSRRVAVALQCLDGMRQGQSLGALLGYWFERGLQENHATLPLAKFLQDLRDRFPATILMDGQPPPGLRLSVDGVALLRATDTPAEREKLLKGSLGATPGERTAIGVELDRLADLLDAISDLCTAEGVHQLARGNVDAAVATTDSLSAGRVPPNPDVIRTPRSEIAILHRVVLRLQDTELARGWPLRETPRAAASPMVDAWLSSHLGDPAEAKAIIHDAGDAEISRKALERVGLRPIDLVFLARDIRPDFFRDGRKLRANAPDMPYAAVELVRRFLEGEPRGQSVTLTASLRCLLVRAQYLGKLLRHARGLRARDLSMPDDTVVPVDDPAAIALAERLKGDLSGLGSRLQVTLNAGSPHDAKELARLLIEATGYGFEVYPGDDVTELAAAAARTSKAIQERLRVAEFAPQREGVGVDRAHLIVQAVFTGDTRPGGAFGGSVPFLARAGVTPPNTFESALKDSARLKPHLPDINAWLWDAARVRPPIDALRSVALFAPGCVRDAVVAQAPSNQPSWAGAAGSAPKSGTVSWVLLNNGQSTPTYGLVLDEWSEAIPRSEVMTGLAFHYDDPGAEAPHAVLVACHPKSDPARKWTPDLLFDILGETLDLAKLRMVDQDLVVAPTASGEKGLTLAMGAPHWPDPDTYLKLLFYVLRRSIP